MAAMIPYGLLEYSSTHHLSFHDTGVPILSTVIRLTGAQNREYSVPCTGRLTLLSNQVKQVHRTSYDIHMSYEYSILECFSSLSPYSGCLQLQVQQYSYLQFVVEHIIGRSTVTILCIVQYRSITTTGTRVLVATVAAKPPALYCANVHCTVYVVFRFSLRRGLSFCSMSLTSYISEVTSSLLRSPITSTSLKFSSRLVAALPAEGIILQDTLAYIKQQIEVITSF